MTNRPRTARGFTLIEMLIVVVLVGILAAIALPSYFQYVQRSKIIEATTGLSNLRTHLEQFFLDNRSYAGGCDATTLTNINQQAQSFLVTCPAPTETAYTLTATGIPAQGMDSAFVYTLDQNNNKTSAGPSGTYTNAACWATRKDGTCG